MKLSEAIMAGSTLMPNAAPDDIATCALGMGMKAVGRVPAFTFSMFGQQWRCRDYESCHQLWPWLAEPIPRSFVPPCGLSMNNFDVWQDVVTHLFDYHVMRDHSWTLEQLVDYVRSIEPAEESTLPDLPLSEQLRLEEEAAAEEGAAIENSGYRDPAENVRFA